jgi:hypothetical protein
MKNEISINLIENTFEFFYLIHLNHEVLITWFLNKPIKKQHLFFEKNLIQFLNRYYISPYLKHMSNKFFIKIYLNIFKCIIYNLLKYNIMYTNFNIIKNIDVM